MKFSMLPKSFLRLTIVINILFFNCLSVISQEIFQLPITWIEPTKYEFSDEIFEIPTIQNQDLDQGKPVFYWKKTVKTRSGFVKLVNFVSTPASKKEVEYLAKISFNVPSELIFDAKITSARNENFAVVYCVPFVLKDGIIQKATSLEITIEESETKEVSVEKGFVTNSVLQQGSGTWYKISVARDGIYKIDKSFLESCGISINGLNPNSINIFGNGDGRLPELNATKRTDDLAKNAIYIEGDADGVFNDNDYILFYGWGPNRWSVSTATSFSQDKNVYSDVSCYYINVNSSDTPLRIQSINSTSLPSTQTIVSYSYFDSHENDLVNLAKGGQRWYGELFDVELEKTFNFSIPSIDVNSPLKISATIASNSRFTSGTSLEYSVNGTTLLTDVLPSTSEGYALSARSFQLANPPTTVPLKITVIRNSPTTLTYLDRIIINGRRMLNLSSSQFNFRDLNSVGAGNIGNFQLTGFSSSGFVWNVTNRHAPSIVLGNLSGTTYSFRLPTDSLREFVASNGQTFYTPDRLGVVVSQNLHGLPQADYLIVTHNDFTSQANRLADLHRANGMLVHVVTTEQVYNEYSSGTPDPTAIRMFAKMFYDRGNLNPSTKPKYLLLFGDGTYDPKNRLSNNNNYVITYQMENGENMINAIVTDDYFGMLDDQESISPSDMLDLGIGRLLVSDNTMAKQQVDKIEHYLKNGSSLFNSTTTNCACDATGYSSTFGDWRLNYVQIADDDNGLFVLGDNEPQYNYTKLNHPEMNCDKIYCDAYTQISSAGGERYPEVNAAITNRVERGALVMNYVGHGGELGLANERILTIPEIQSWKNIDKMNLFVSATCEFTRFDDPARVSAGEWGTLNPYGGSIVMMTTTRPIYISVNTLIGEQFFKNVFQRDAQKQPKTFGEIIRLTKNAAGGSDNKRCFTLIGDPALQIALPKMKVITDSVNGLNPSIEIDTIRALSKMTIKGHIEDWNGNDLTSFNGVVYPTIFDKIKMQKTLGQDPNTPIISFETQRNIVYKGKATVTNGHFEFSFVVPKDINFTYGPGKISYYANNENIDAQGYDNQFVIGGLDSTSIADDKGPTIELFFNDQKFVSGGITDKTPILIANLFDENGINTVGNGIGHDITAILDDNTANPIVLNEYYVANLDSYQSGKVRYVFPPVANGTHKLTLKAWDVNNNSSQASLNFVVQEKVNFSLAHVLNYPNPFTTHTEFFFEHNQVRTELEAQIQVFTVSGKLIKTINQVVKSEGYRSEGIVWDGKDDFGDQLAKGVYVYLLRVKNPSGESSEKVEKLVILK
jgi:hypothetical protein